jgi:hypothetical protein
VDQDANGMLIEDWIAKNNDDNNFAKDSHANLSPCTVGHLAQHTFGRILYEEAISQRNTCTVLYETAVERVEQ